MEKMKNLRILTSGFLMGAIFFGGISYAADALKIDAYYGVKLIQNGVDKTPVDQELKPFIANGSTFVPLKVIGDLVKVDVKWDGDNNSVIIGEKIKSVSLSSPSNTVINGPEFAKNSPDFLDIKQNQPMKVNKVDYGSNGFTIKHLGYEGIVTFPLNGQYSNLSLTLGYDDIGSSRYGTSRHVTFLDQDGKVLEERTIGPGATQDLSINVKGVLKLQVKIEKNDSSFNAQIDLINPVLTIN